LEVARFSYVQGQNNDKYDQFTINLAPGDYIIDNRPGKANTAEVPELSDQSNFEILDPNNDLYKFNSVEGGLVIPRGTSIVGILEKLGFVLVMFQILLIVLSAELQFLE
jgi:hypothetical protein